MTSARLARTAAFSVLKAAVALTIVLASASLAVIVGGPAALAAQRGHPHVTISRPAPASTVPSRAPEFSGTGAAGASITVTDPAGTLLCSARVSGDGWSCTAIRDMGDGSTGATARQYAWGEVTTASTHFTVDSGGADPANIVSYASAFVSAGIILVLGALTAVITTIRVRVTRAKTRARAIGLSDTVPEERP